MLVRPKPVVWEMSLFFFLNILLSQYVGIAAGHVNEWLTATKGPFIFLIKWGGWGGWRDLKGGGGHEKIGFKGWIKRKKNIGFRGGSLKNSFKFSSDGICNNANSLPECQKPECLTFRKFRFFRGTMPPDPLLYYASKGNSTSLKCKKV